MIYRNDLIDARDRSTILDIVVEVMLKHGTGEYVKSLRRYVPYWKNTHLYDKGIIISRHLIVDVAPKWKIAAALKKMKWPDYLPYNRDFFQGIIDAGCTGFKNGVHIRLEFSSSRGHLMELFRDIGIPCRDKTSKNICRTVNIPFLMIEPSQDMESQFIGIICGSRVHVDDGGQIRMSVRKKCRTVLKELGIFYDEDKNGLLIDCFYFMLFMGELPDPVVSYWLAQFPLRKSMCFRSSSMVANIHWRILFSTEKQIDEGLPFLKEAREAWRLGITRDLLKDEMKRRKFHFIDERIRKRCLRWAALKRDEVAMEPNE